MLDRLRLLERFTVRTLAVRAVRLSGLCSAKHGQSLIFNITPFHAGSVKHIGV